MKNGDDTKYSKTLTSLSNSSYPTTENPSVREPFRFMKHKWTDVKNNFSTYMLSEETNQIMSIRG